LGSQRTTTSFQQLLMIKCVNKTLNYLVHCQGWCYRESKWCIYSIDKESIVSV